MMKTLLLLVATCYCISTTQAERKGKVLMCYVMSWSIYRPAEGLFDMKDIDPHLCTHIIYSYNSLNATNWQIESRDNWADFGEGNVKKLVELKKRNPVLKILTCIGGWGEGSEKFSKMVEKKEHRQTFVESVMKYLGEHKLDGLDIDWQHPTRRGGKPEDKQNFVLLLEELRRVFNRKEYLLTVRLTGSRYAAEGYDLLGISDSVDYINLKSYAYHGTWESVTGVYSPLESQSEDNVEFSVNFILEQGVPSKKLLLGLSTESNAFLLDQNVTDNNYIGQEAKENFKGPWLSENGVLGYNEICWELTRKNVWTTHWDLSSSTPYATNGKMFVSHENKRSYEEKLSLVGDKSLGGVSLYSLDTDDFKGLCYNKPFILTNTAKRLLGHFDFEVNILNQYHS